MTSELNFEAMPFEFDGETQDPSSETSGVEPEEFEHHGGRHHHRRQRRRHRHYFPSFPIAAFPFPDDDNDDSQPPFDDAGEFESEEEAEHRFWHGDPNFWRHRHHYSARGDRPYWQPPSFPYNGSPSGGFDDSQPSAEAGGLELEEELIRDHRHGGGLYRDHRGGAPNVWRERTWGTGRAPQWRQGNFPIGSPSYLAVRRRRPWRDVGDPNWWRQWNFPKVGWPRDARVRRWWRSGGAQEPYGGWTGPDFRAAEPYSIETMPGGAEYMRWVQGALNDVLGLRLPTHGIADPPTRSAIRSFQQQKGLPVDGVVGPDTQRALAAARADGSPRAGAPMPPTAPDMAGPPVGPPPMPDTAAAAQSPASSPTMPVSTPGMPDAGQKEFDFEWENFATLNPPVAVGCAPEPGEVAASHSDAGILTKDVENTKQGVLVADFGIDWRSVKERAKIELAPYIHMLETEPTITEIWICGYTDCIGPGDARYHTSLRTERARRVFNLLGPIAKKKVKVVGPAPIGRYFGPNTDRVGRARNRSVLIKYKTVITMPEEPISVPLPWDQFVPKALDVLKRQRQIGITLGVDQTRRLACLLQGTLDPNFDDRFINYWDLWAFQQVGVGNDPAWDMIIKRTRKFLDTSRLPTADDRFILRALELMDQSIFRGVKWLDMQYQNMGSAMSPRMVKVKDWIADQQKKPNNVYSCYR